MKKVLVFTSTFPRFTPGDATPTFVYELSRRLARESLDISVLTPRVPGSKMYEERDGLRIYRYPYFFSEKLEQLCDGAILPNLKSNKWLYIQVPFLIFSGFFYLWRTIKREKIDIIHAHWIIPQGFLAVLYKRIFDKNIKVITTSHGSDIFGLNGKVGTFLKRFTLHNIDALTVVSSSIKDKVLTLGNFPNLPIEIAPMGVDEEKFHPKFYDENIKKKYNITGPLLLFVGRLAEVKGVEYLINALPGVVDKYPSTKLLIIGNGPLESELKKLTSSLSLDNNIIFLGGVPHDELPRYYATADIFIGPSISTTEGTEEGFGLVFVEAIISGCISIGSNLKGITDIIEDEKTGFLTNPNNHYDISSRIFFLLDKNFFDKKVARDIIKLQFSWNIIIDKYHLIINRL